MLTVPPPCTAIWTILHCDPVRRILHHEVTFLTSSTWRRHASRRDQIHRVTNNTAPTRDQLLSQLSLVPRAFPSNLPEISTGCAHANAVGSRWNRRVTPAAAGVASFSAVESHQWGWPSGTRLIPCVADSYELSHRLEGDSAVAPARRRGAKR